jgi:hypothetical protein
MAWRFTFELWSRREAFAALGFAVAPPEMMHEAVLAAGGAALHI